MGKLKNSEEYSKTVSKHYHELMEHCKVHMDRDGQGAAAAKGRFE